MKTKPTLRQTTTLHRGPWPRPADVAEAVVERLPITALITSFNEEDKIEDCIRSVLWCEEILLVDSFSHDRTVEIAARFPRVRVLQRQYLGAASQKNWAINRSRFDWILVVDADERVTPELQAEIKDLFNRGIDDTAAFAIPRTTFFLGRRMRYSGWQHDRVTRLFNRFSARYPNRRVHADMETRTPPQMLESPLVHLMVDDLSEYTNRLQRYARWGAAQLWTEGRTSGPYEVICRPLWRFVRTYLLQLGFLEGLPGLVLCAVHSWSVFLKWSILWGWYRNQKNGLEPDLPDFDRDPATWEWLNESLDQPPEPAEKPAVAATE